MSGRAPLRVLLLTGGLSLASPAAAVEWSFRPDAEASQGYTSNAQRTTTGSESDLITALRVNLPIEGRGRASRFEFAYAPTYEYFWDNHDLNALNHFARAGWNREGSRVDVVTLATYRRGQDPRLGTTPAGQTPAPDAPAEVPFLVQRSETVEADLSALLGFKVGRSTRIETSAFASEQRYADPSLIDSGEIRGAVGMVHEVSPRQQWTARLRASRFSSDELGSESVAIVEGGGEFELHRGLRLTAELGAIVAASGGILDELATGDQVLGKLVLDGTTRVVTWSAGVNRDVSTGGGLRLAVLKGEAIASLGLRLGSRDTLGFSASRSHSRQPVENGTTLDLTSDDLALRADHQFSPAWSASLEAGRLEQESDDAGPVGTFKEDRVAIAVRWAAPSRGAR